MQEGEKKGLDEGSHQVETSFTELHKRYDQMRQLMVAVWQRGKSLTQHNQELQAKIQVGWCLGLSCVTLRVI